MWTGIDEYFSAAYEDLRALASRVGRRRGAALHPTELVSEAWLRLARPGSACPESDEHFRAAAARAMRHALIDAARRRKAAKRGGEEDVLILEGDEGAGRAPAGERERLALKDAMTELERANARMAKVVEYRYYGGYSFSEIAALLHVGEATVHRDWRVARAWLKARIAPA